MEFLKTILMNRLGANGGYWRLENDGEDAGPNNLDLTLVGSPTFTTGKFGQAITTASSKYAKRNSTTDFDVTTGAISFGAWFKTSDNSAFLPIISKELSGPTYYGYVAFINVGIVHVEFVSAAGNDTLDGGDFNDGQWHHIVVTRPSSGGSIRVYIDGELNVSTTNNNRDVTNSANLNIGSRNNGGDSLYFPGDIEDAFCMPGVELSAKDVKELFYGRLIGEALVEPTMSALYHLGGLTDFSGNHRTLTNNNSVAFVTGMLGKRADFGASNSTKSLSRSDALGLTGSDQMTISCIFELQTLPGTNEQQQLFHLNMATGSINYYGSYKDVAGTKKLYIQRNKNGVGVEDADVSIDLQTGKKYLVDFVYDGSNIKIYLNGAQVCSGSASGTGSNPVTNLFALGYDGGSGDYFKGYMDEVVVVPRAKTAKEIRRRYAAFRGFVR